MSDTPRTDAIFPLVMGCPVVVPETIYELRQKFEDMERELVGPERVKLCAELDTAKAEVAKLREELHHAKWDAQQRKEDAQEFHDQRDAARAEIAKLRGYVEHMLPYMMDEHCSLCQCARDALGDKS